MNGVINGLLVRLRYQQKGKRVHNKFILNLKKTFWCVIQLISKFEVIIIIRYFKFIVI